MSCCSRLEAEWQLSMFSLEDTTGQTVDLKQALAPKPTLLYGTIKFFILCCFIIFCIIDIMISPDGAYWPIFLTNWGIILMYVYMIATTFGYIRTMYLENLETQKETENNNNTFLTRFISTFGVLAICIEVLIIIIYWLTIYDGEVITFYNLSQHGILGVLVLFDKLVIHRMPIRFKQILIVYIFSIAFAIWTVIHAISGIGQPVSDNDPETDDDAIYPTVNWIKRPGSAANMVSFLLVIVTPTIFFALFGLSTFVIKPRYYNSSTLEAERGDDEDQTDEERVVHVY